VVLLAAGGWGALARAASPASTPEDAPATVSAEASPQLFATMCALYAAGFEAQSSALDSNPGFSAVRSQLLALRGPAAEALRSFYREHVLADPGATMSRYITFALVAGPPPKFAFTLSRDELPPDALALDGFSEVLANFYQEAQLDRLWVQLQPGYDRAVAAERQPLGNIVLLETGYLRELLRPGKRTFTVYVEPLVGGRTNVRNMDHFTRPRSGLRGCPLSFTTIFPHLSRNASYMRWSCGFATCQPLSLPLR
jgi:hypothetical protein